MNHYNNHLIYVYEFNENIAYVGQTVNIRKRHSYHLRDKRSNIKDFIQKNNITNPTYIILEENIKMAKVKNRENFWIDFYKQKGFVLLNKIKGGGVGSKNKIKYADMKRRIKSKITI